MSDRRDFLMLAHDFDPDKHRVSDMFVSTKLDGQRAFWDGGISRNVPKDQVPWSNTDKDKRYRDPPIATGLWSRYGNVIHAPDWFLDKLPKGIFLDGELYLGRGQFQKCRSIVSHILPGEGWKEIQYKVFEIPSPNVLFQSGQIKGTNFTKYIDDTACEAFLREKMTPALRSHMERNVLAYSQTTLRMQRLTEVQNDTWSFLKQLRLPPKEDEARAKLYTLLDAETSKGGEGLILRSPSSIWVPKRVQNLLKVKKFMDDEGTIIGYVAGEAGKEGRLLGMLGALRIQWNAKSFNLSGFTNAERVLSAEGREWALKHPGELYPGTASISKQFKYGDTVRFRYMTLTNDGKPREPRFFR